MEAGVEEMKTALRRGEVETVVAECEAVLAQGTQWGEETVRTEGHTAVRLYFFGSKPSTQGIRSIGLPGIPSEVGRRRVGVKESRGNAGDGDRKDDEQFSR